jgi:hypothetical protein
VFIPMLPYAMLLIRLCARVLQFYFTLSMSLSYKGLPAIQFTSPLEVSG